MSVQHKDIPDAQLHEIKGAASAPAGYIPMANGSGSAPFVDSGFTKSRVGFWDYHDTATSTTQIALTSANTEYQLTNNGLGANTLKTYAIPGITDIFNTSTNYFVFSSLKLGDVVEVRVDLDITTTSASNVLDIGMELGVGATPYKLYFDSRYYKNAGTYKAVAICSFYIGNTLTKSNPGRIIIKNDSTGSTVKVNGWYTKVITNG